MNIFANNDIFWQWLSGHAGGERKSITFILMALPFFSSAVHVLSSEIDCTM
jgi:hypothetical protein